MKTERLILRPLAATDAPRIAHLAGDWDIARMTARIPHPYPLTSADRWIADLDDNEHIFAIDLDGMLIGACGYDTEAGDGQAEIGYWIGKPYWGRGYATEAASAVVRAAFAAGVKRLTCCHFTDNQASARVIAKLGFRRTGTCRAWCEARGEEVATITYARRRPLALRLFRRAA